MDGGDGTPEMLHTLKSIPMEKYYRQTQLSYFFPHLVGIWQICSHQKLPLKLAKVTDDDHS